MHYPTLIPMSIKLEFFIKKIVLAAGMNITSYWLIPALRAIITWAGVTWIVQGSRLEFSKIRLDGQTEDR